MTHCLQRSGLAREARALAFRSCAVFVTASLFAAAAAAQVQLAEVEPNGDKSEATAASGLIAGDVLTGTSTGTIDASGDSALDTADTFRVKTAAAPLSIYRHVLKVTTSGPTGHSGRLLGLTQQDGVIQPTDTVFQFSTNAPTVNESAWYGFGKQEEIYYRVVGTASSSAPYAATLSTTSVTPISVAGTFLPGPVTVTTAGQGHVSDTEIYVYDAALNPVPLGHNDGSSPADPALSAVTVTLAAGTYYAAVSSYNTANDQSDLNPAEFWDDEAVLDFADAMANSHGSSPYDVSFAIGDGTITVQVPAQMSQPFDIVWARFTVGSVGTAYCSGDGSGTACPCANPGAAGHGCASSVDASGARLEGSGVPSIANDTFVLVGSGMPNSFALYFQGTAQTGGGAGASFGDGLRCVGGSVIRLGTKLNAGGSSTYPAAGDVAISIRGANSAGAVRMHQVWYRNAASFCTPATFNLTNGLQVTWGA